MLYSRDAFIFSVFLTKAAIRSNIQSLKQAFSKNIADPACNLKERFLQSIKKQAGAASSACFSVGIPAPDGYCGLGAFSCKSRSTSPTMDRAPGFPLCWAISLAAWKWAWASAQSPRWIASRAE